ncbi:hypothetical protein EC988_007442, partial [Linderina pennispora]
MTTSKHRDELVRKAVARKIAQKMKRNRAAKHRHTASIGAAALASLFATDPAAISSAGVMSGASSGFSSDAEHYGTQMGHHTQPVFDLSMVETELVRRIRQLQREKEQLLQIMQQA